MSTNVHLHDITDVPRLTMEEFHDWNHTTPFCRSQAAFLAVAATPNLFLGYDSPDGTSQSTHEAIATIREYFRTPRIIDDAVMAEVAQVAVGYEEQEELLSFLCSHRGRLIAVVSW